MSSVGAYAVDAGLGVFFLVLIVFGVLTAISLRRLYGRSAGNKRSRRDLAARGVSQQRADGPGAGRRESGDDGNGS